MKHSTSHSPQPLKVGENERVSFHTVPRAEFPASAPPPKVVASTRTKTLNLNGGSKKTISKAIKRRAQAIIEDRSIDPQSRVIIRYGLETNDLWLPELVRRIEAGETIIETIVLLKHS